MRCIPVRRRRSASEFRSFHPTTPSQESIFSAHTIKHVNATQQPRIPSRPPRCGFSRTHTGSGSAAHRKRHSDGRDTHATQKTTARLGDRPPNDWRWWCLRARRESPGGVAWRRLAEGGGRPKAAAETHEGSRIRPRLRDHVTRFFRAFFNSLRYGFL